MEMEDAEVVTNMAQHRDAAEGIVADIAWRSWKPKAAKFPTVRRAASYSYATDIRWLHDETTGGQVSALLKESSKILEHAAHDR